MGIFNEKLMFDALQPLLPNGETISAAIYAAGKEMRVKFLFKNCRVDDDLLIPDNDGSIIEITKGKLSVFDAYIGLTANYLILEECMENKHFYQFDEEPRICGAEPVELSEKMLLKDLKFVFPLANVAGCEVKNAMMGSVKLTVKMKDGSILKLMVPKRGGLGGGLPNQEQNRQMIIDRLTSL